MAFNPHVAPDFEDFAVSPDQNRGAKNALEGSAIHRFFAPRAIGREHFMRLIRGKRNRKLVLVSKGFLRPRRIT